MSEHRDVPRCRCGFILPGPLHGRECRLYVESEVYPTPSTNLKALAELVSRQALEVAQLRRELAELKSSRVESNLSVLVAKLNEIGGFVHRNQCELAIEGLLSTLTLLLGLHVDYRYGRLWISEPEKEAPKTEHFADGRSGKAGQ